MSWCLNVDGRNVDLLSGGKPRKYGCIYSYHWGFRNEYYVMFDGKVKKNQKDNCTG